MHYTYVLLSEKDKQMYIGCTKDLQKRIQEHNSGDVSSTKSRLPLHVIHYEAFASQADAYARERWLKTGWGHNQLRKMLLNSLEISVAKGNPPKLSESDLNKINLGLN